jgi:hypothetical protein
MVEMTAVFAPAEPNFLDFRDDGLPIGMAEWRVVDHDVVGADTLRFEIGLEDLVGGARVDIVGPGEHPALDTFLLCEIIHRGYRLLIGRGAGVEDILRALLAFILNWIEQQAVEFLEDREHRFARHRCPASEGRRDLVLGNELACFLGEERPVGRRIDHDGFQLLAEQSALGILLGDQHEHHVLERGLRDRHRPGQRMKHTDLDRLAFGQSGPNLGKRQCRERQARHFEESSS